MPFAGPQPRLSASVCSGQAAGAVSTVVFFVYSLPWSCGASLRAELCSRRNHTPPASVNINADSARTNGPGAFMEALHYAAVDFLCERRRAVSPVSPSSGEQSNCTICYRIYDVIPSTHAPLTPVQVNNEQRDVALAVGAQMNGAGMGEQRDAEQNSPAPRDRS